MPAEFSDVNACVDLAIDKVGRRLIVAAPLGLGKPNQLLNAFYQRALDDSSIQLEILTALSLERPSAHGELEQNFLQPFVERQFGDYETLAYVKAQRQGRLPANIKVSEFYFKAGSMLNAESAQCDYICTNYTFAARDILARGANVLVQLVAEAEVDGERRLSLACNTDVSLDLLPAIREQKDYPVVALAQVHDELPFMYHKAALPADRFDAVIRNPDYNTRLFATPNMSVAAADFALGFRASTLIRDGGTLQIGIGSLGDAITYACMLRHSDNDSYRAIASDLQCEPALVDNTGGLGCFEQGLYGCSEMFVNGFVHLMKAGVLKRKVYDDLGLQALIDQGRLRPELQPSALAAIIEAGLVGTPLNAQGLAYLQHWGILSNELTLEQGELLLGDQSVSADLSDADNLARLAELALGTELKHGVLMHGGFFLGPEDFYQALRDMPRAQRELISMDSVRRINRMDDVPLQSLQRRHARFINTGMMVTLSGAVVSDGLENGQVVSGVGGQYNFVAQAHELEDARSIICIRSTRGSGKHCSSNIVPAYGHTTIPRHLRDIVITEYGVADLRGKTDSEVIKALLNIADSRFQYELLGHAISFGKIEADYAIPKEYCDNTPQRISDCISRWRARGLFPAFPLGCDFTDEEVALAQSLRELKSLLDDPKQMIKSVIRSFTHDVDHDEAEHYLQRIGLEHPDTPKEILLQHLLLLELEEHGHLRPL